MKFDLASALWRSPSLSVDTEYESDFAVETYTEVLSRVILFNDDHHTFDEVIEQVCKATGCSEFRAEAIAWEVHLRGQSCVHEGEIFECLRVSSVLEEIALHTQVLT